MEAESQTGFQAPFNARLAQADVLQGPGGARLSRTCAADRSFRPARCGSLAKAPAYSVQLQEASSERQLGEGGSLIHYVLQADQSASLWKLPHKLLWTWFRGMEREKAIIPQNQGGQNRVWRGPGIWLLGHFFYFGDLV